MKKLTFLLAVLILSIPCTASNYRGMFEIGAGPMFANEKIHTTTGDFKNKQTTIGGIFTTSQGCQFTPWLFAGAGVGVNLECKCKNVGESAQPDNARTSKNTLISIPLFLDIRWDLDLNRKFSPYADLRLGYQLGMDGYVMYKAKSITNPQFITAGWMKSTDGMYVQATAGIRCKLGDNTGVNLGISFIPIVRRQIDIKMPLYANRSFLLLNVGIDIQGSGKSTIKEDRKEKLYRLQQKKLKQQSKKINFQ